MDQFIPPVKDMIFALREVVGKGDLNSNSGFEDFDRYDRKKTFDTIPDQLASISTARRADLTRADLTHM